VSPPNQSEVSFGKHVGSTSSLGMTPSSIHAPSNSEHPFGVHVGSSASLSRSGSPVTKPDDKVKLGKVKMDQPQSQVSVGSGMVPVRANKRGGGTVAYMKKGK